MTPASTWRRHTPYLIAEIGVNHDGDVDRAEAMVRAAAEAGFDAVKFQYWVVDELLAEDVPNAPYQGNGDQRALLASLELSVSDLSRLRDVAHELGMEFIVTADGTRALDDVLPLEPDVLKVGSGDADNPWLLDALVTSGRPLIVSTGMTGSAELQSLVARVGHAPEVVLLHCVSAYPTALSQARLGRLATLRDLGLGPVGFSDHTIGVAAAAAAVALGAVVVEKHVTWSTGASGPDHACSLELSRAAEWVTAVRGVAAAVTDDVVSVDEEANREVVRKALHARRDLAPGQVLVADDVVPLRPLLDGIPAGELDQVLGNVVTREIVAGTRLRRDDLEPRR